MLVWVAYVKFKRFVGYKKRTFYVHMMRLSIHSFSFSLSLSQVESPH